MSANDNLQQKLRDGVDAAKRGDRITARRLLEQVVQADENNEMAWMWLASAVNTVAERRECLQRVLQINPKNARAAEALRRLERGGGSTSAEEQRARETIAQFRQSAPAPRPAATQDETAGGLPINTSTLILIGVVLAVIVGALAVSSALGGLDLQPQPTVPAVVLVTATPEDTPTPPPTQTPLSPDSITRTVRTLPPTLTATRTPTPSPTPEPTPEPTPLGLFEVLYASLSPDSDQPNMYVVQADGSNEGFMTDAARDMRYAPDGERIAFVRDVQPGDDENPPIAEIFITTFSNPGSAEQLTSLGAPDTRGPSWSPDGRQIVFSSSYDSDSEELWIIDVESRTLRRLTQDAFIDRDPAWSPLGDVILFTSDRFSPGFTEIYAMTLPEDEDSLPTDIVRLTQAANNSYSASWAADASFVVFASDRDGFSDLYTMLPNGDNPQPLRTTLNRVENRRPDPSPDGRWIAFISNRDGNFQTYVTDRTGSEVLRISASDRDDQSVVFRPVPPLD